MLSNEKSLRKPSGGINHTKRRKKKKLHELRNAPAYTSIAEKNEKRSVIRTRGGNIKVVAKKVKFANIKLDNGKIVKAEIINEYANKANKHFIRRNILTKGAEIEAKINDKIVKAKITSRPGQHGIVNAVQI